MYSRRVSCQAVALTLIFGSLASGSIININNPSFESPALSSPGDFTPGNAVSQWDTTALGVFAPDFIGEYYPLVGTDVNTVPAGNQVLFEAADSQSWFQASQQLTDGANPLTIAADMTYTLDVFVGARLNVAAAPYQIAIFDLTQNDYLASANCGTPSPGDFIDCSVSYDSLAADLGDNLSIVLAGEQPTGNSQILFDNVSVTAATSAPEPGSIALVLAVLAAFAAGWTWRKAKAKAAEMR
jgi:hypothetical protein